MVKCGWASIGSNGSATGDQAGDQNGKEVKVGDWYNFKQVALYRFKNRSDGIALAKQIERACLNDNIGYNQATRTTFYNELKKSNFNIEGIRSKCDCDCSSLVGACLVSIGVDIPHNITTASLDKHIMATGLFDKFTASKYLTSDKFLKVGDIINRPSSHVIVALESYENESLDYVSGNRYLSMEEMTRNAKYLYQKLRVMGWSTEAIAGFFGNVQTESGFNPAIWQSLNEGNLNGGFGLVQWTPCKNFFDWCDSNGLARDKMETQLSRIQYEMDNNLQYYPTSNYPLTFKKFIVSRETPEYLASTFLMNYERPKNPNHNERQSQARYWYNKINAEDWDSGTDIPEPPIIPIPPEEEKSDNIYERLEESNYNMKQLNSDEVNFLKRISIGDTVKMGRGLDRNKRRIGTNLFGKRLTFDNLPYRIIDVTKSGFIKISFEETSFYKLINPKQLQMKSGALLSTEYDSKSLSATIYDSKEITAYDYDKESQLEL